MADIDASAALEAAPSFSPPTATASTAHHRRIDLQAPADLFYLKNNARLSARTKIDLHLPLAAALREDRTGVDGMRTRVEGLVNAYIEDTFEMAKRSIAVNGVEGEKVLWERAVPEEFEPYDYELAHRIAAMHSTIESLNLSLANTRREAVATAAQSYQDKFTEYSREADDALSQQEGNAKGASVTESQLAAAIQLGIQGREEQVRRLWDTALEGVGKLQTGLGETRANAEGAEQVVSYLKGKS